jgi:hypothetical protein
VGDIGAGQTVTAFYESIPADSDEFIPQVNAVEGMKNLEKRSDDFMGLEAIVLF